MTTAPKATGTQIAFFTFAVLILATAGATYLTKTGSWSGAERSLLGRSLIFLPTALIFIVIRPLRLSAMELLGAPVPAHKWREVVVVAFAKACLYGFAVVGGIALWHWLGGGAIQLENRMLRQASPETEMLRAVSMAGLLDQFLFATLIVPIIEELVFRGYLYRAWEERWGWFAAMLASSALFGLYHPNFTSSFASALFYCALFRRTGTLWAPIMVHAAYNLAVWYPLMGRELLPVSPDARSNIAAWTWQLAALAAIGIALPVYIWLARRPYSGNTSHDN